MILKPHLDNGYIIAKAMKEIPIISGFLEGIAIRWFGSRERWKAQILSDRFYDGQISLDKAYKELDRLVNSGEYNAATLREEFEKDLSAEAEEMLHSNPSNIPL